MKLGRNTLCPCGSGKKYKQCCMDNTAKQHAQIADDISQIIAMNPHLTLDEIKIVVEQKMNERNQQADANFCGLSPMQIANWLYAPMTELENVTINVPNDLSRSPVMRYLALIIEYAMQQNGSFKTTTKGNLPANLVKQANELLAEFAIAEFETEPSISEYMGINEDKFNALHYTRILAEMAGILYRRNGRFHIKKTAQKYYQTDGINAFFLPMLTTAITQYNWGYFDNWDNVVPLHLFWLFMLWRLETHADVNKLIAEMYIAFPHLLTQLPEDHYFSPKDQLASLIKSRFIERFLEFWGFVTVKPSFFTLDKHHPNKANIQPLFNETFKFSI